MNWRNHPETILPERQPNRPKSTSALNPRSPHKMLQSKVNNPHQNRSPNHPTPQSPRHTPRRIRHQHSQRQNKQTSLMTKHRRQRSDKIPSHSQPLPTTQISIRSPKPKQQKKSAKKISPATNPGHSLRINRHPQPDHRRHGRRHHRHTQPPQQQKPNHPIRPMNQQIRKVKPTRTPSPPKPPVNRKTQPIQRTISRPTPGPAKLTRKRNRSQQEPMKRSMQRTKRRIIHDLIEIVINKRSTQRPPIKRHHPKPTQQRKAQPRMRHAPLPNQIPKGDTRAARIPSRLHRSF